MGTIKRGKKSCVVMLRVVYNTEYCKMMNDKSGESIFENQLKENVTKNCDTIILGDLSTNLLNLDKETAKNKRKAKKLKSLFKPYNLNQIIKEATRIDPTTGKEFLLDHIWTNTEVQKSGIYPGLSDQKATFINIKTSKPKIKPEKIKIRNFKNYKQDDFLETLKDNLNKSKITD